MVVLERKKTAEISIRLMEHLYDAPYQQIISPERSAQQSQQQKIGFYQITIILHFTLHSELE